jgi:hypothetical protein
MTQQIDLTSARAKLRHAEEHIATLRTFTGTARSQEENQLCVSVELDSAAGLYILRIARTPDLASIAGHVRVVPWW